MEFETNFHAKSSFAKAMRFIQNMQLVKKVTIRNMDSNAIDDEFARQVIYSIRDLYSRYDQFQLAMQSRDLTTM